MRQHWKRRLGVAALLLGASLACSPPEHRQAPPPPDAAQFDDRTPEDGGTVVLRLDTDIRSLNPVFINSVYEKEVASFLFDGLLELDQEGRVIPGIAKSWEISPDGKAYTFHLGTSTFSDGTAVKAADVIFTLNHILHDSPELSGAFEGMQTAGTRAIDDQTVQVAFDKARAGQLLAFGTAILPEHIYSKGDFAKDYAFAVTGNGPYRLLRRTAGKEVVLQRRGDYPGKKPHLEYVMFKVIGDASVAWDALRRGDIDEMELNSEQWTRAQADAGFQREIDLRRFYKLGYNFIPWNTRNPILADKRVRQALSMCLDRKSIIQHVYGGTARVITGPFTPDQWAYNPEVPPVEFNPAAAKQLLSDAGWRDTDRDGVLDQNKLPLEIRMLVPSGSRTSIEQAQIFQDSLKQIGVKLDLEQLDNATLIGRVTQGKFEATFLSWDLDLDPDLYALFHTDQIPPHGQNWVFYSNPEVDALLVQGREAMDQKQRTVIYQKLHQILAADQPYTWVLQESVKWASNKRLRNVKESRALGPFFWVPGPRDWWIPTPFRKRELSASR
ncbi:MAG TPA: ABC transporter substrate-binding protein [Thermoanaerobaculia bacterium]|nr:ABC transporter substrate-binding protein [Thermoanaerobaculia bacterium]